MSERQPSDIAIKKADEFLDQMGWKHELSSQGEIVTYYGGQFGTVNVKISARSNGLFLCINPVVSQGDDLWGKSVARLIEALTREIHLIQVGMDTDKNVYVQVELPFEQLGFEEFVYVLLNLCQVSDQLLVPILQAQAYDTHNRDSIPNIMHG